MTARETVPAAGASPATTSIVVRPAERDDIRKLDALESDAFAHDRLSTRSFRRFAAPGGHALLVAVDGADHVVGYALILLRRGGATARLYSIAVARHAHRRGIGDRLLAEAEAVAKDHGAERLRLEVRDDNHVAANWYLARSYRPLGRRTAYYSDGTDALRLEKALAPVAPGA